VKVRLRFQISSLSKQSVRIPTILSHSTLFDGVVGLAPFNVSNLELGTPSLLKALVKHRTLERNVFALRLPYEMWEEGELIFGQVPQEAGDLVGRFKLSGSSYRCGGWSVDFDRLEWDGKRSQFPKNTTMAILFRDHRIGLPLELAEAINIRITIDEDGIVVDCATRSELSELRLGLGGRAKLVLRGYDYTAEWKGPDGSTRCFSNVWRAIDPIDSKIYLGFESLKRFITVFDLDNGEIRRMCSHISYPISQIRR
jgi:aspartyl protease